MGASIRSEIIRSVNNLHSNLGILLYGSQAKQEANEHSDYDCAVIVDSQKNEFSYEDIPNSEGLEIDLVVIPLNMAIRFIEQKSAQQDEPFKRFYRSVVLSQQNEIVTQLAQKIEQIILQGPEPIPLEEKSKIKKWILKTLFRINRNEIGSQFRKHELFFHLLTHYFILRDRWYLGVNESFKILGTEDIQTFRLFQDTLAANLESSKISRLAEAVMHNS